MASLELGKRAEYMETMPAGNEGSCSPALLEKTAHPPSCVTVCTFLSKREGIYRPTTFRLSAECQMKTPHAASRVPHLLDSFCILLN